MAQLYKPEKRLIVTEFDDLDDFNPATKIQRQPAKFVPTVDLSLAEDMRLISFDPSMTNTGYVICDYTSELGLVVIDTGVIRTAKTERTSWDDTLFRAEEIYEETCHLLHDRKLSLILHETPPVGGGPTQHNQYAPIVSSTAVRCAARRFSLPVAMVAANRVKKYLTGNARADKKEVQIALKFLYGDRLVGHKMTEHNWDALGIAHCYVSGPT